MIYLHKLLPLVVSPLGLICALLLFGMVRRRVWPIYLASIIMLVSAWPLTARLVWSALESKYRYTRIHDVRNADAVIVLSGMLGGFKSDSEYVTQWGDPDRFFAGISLMKAGKAKKLIFTRGKMPWDDAPPEGEVLAEKALDLGLKRNDILLTAIVSNTSEEANAFRALANSSNIHSVILVTSSFHMPRAHLLFKQAGVEVIPYPTDFKVGEGKLTWLDYIPSASAFSMTSAGIREHLGRAYYWIYFALKEYSSQ